MTARRWSAWNKQRRTPLQRRGTPRRRSLAFQSLENRQLLAVLSNMLGVGSGLGQVTIEVNEQGAFGVSPTLDVNNPAVPANNAVGDTLFTPADFTLRTAMVMLTGSEVVPPVNTVVAGSADIQFDPADGTFDIDLLVMGLTPSSLLGSSIQAGPFGAEGPVIFDLGDGTAYVQDPNGLRLVLQDVAFPAASLADLFAGDTYIEIASATNPLGEIRGQIVLDPPTEAMNTVYESGVAIRPLEPGAGREFLTAGTIGGTGNNINGAFLNVGPQPQFSTGRIDSRFFWPNNTPAPAGPDIVPPGAVLEFDLMQSLVDLRRDGVQEGTALVQNYRITNVSGSEFSFEILRYLDGDLFSDGAISTPLFDGGGAGMFDTTRSTITVFQTDEPFDDVIDDETFVGVQSTAVGASGFAPWEVGTAGNLLPQKPAGDLLGRIIAGQPLRNDVIPASADVSLDNGIRDLGMGDDVAVAQSQEFLDVAPGETVLFTTITIFGHAPQTFTPPGEPPFGSVEGTKFLDANANGVFDQGESGASGVTIFADLNQNGLLDAVEPFAVTSVGGSYSLTVPVGVNQIREVVPAGFTQTFPAGGFQLVNVQTAGQLVSDINFGNAPSAGSITGLKFEDENANGIFDGAEQGIPGVTIFLDQDDDGVLDVNEARTTTDVFGDYLFQNLPPGNYVVREVAPVGSQQTLPGGDGAYRVTLLPGQSLSFLDFGNTFPSNMVGVGDGPVDVILADVNNDGVDDIITANLLSDDVSVVFGLGNGNFGLSTEFSAGPAPTAVTAADLDLDGDLDLVVGLQIGSSVAVLANVGNGVFGPAQLFDVGGEQSDVLTFDFFGNDGRPDIFVTLPLTDEVAVLRNLGPGLSFDAPVFFPVSAFVGRFPVAMDAGDLDGDGLVDLAVVNQTSSTLSVLRNIGGDFDFPVELITGAGPSSVVIADVNGNGANDLAVANESAGSVTVFYNNVFPTSATFGTPGSPVDITSGSFQNGFVDLAVALETSNAVAFLENDGTGAFPTNFQVAVGNMPFAVFSGNVDSDGTSDLLAANFADDTVSVILNAGEGEPSDHAGFLFGGADPAPPDPLLPADVDRNGAVEVFDLLVLINAFRNDHVLLAEIFGRLETFDVSRDGSITLDDLLRVAQHLREQFAQSGAEGEPENAEPASDAYLLPVAARRTSSLVDTDADDEEASPSSTPPTQVSSATRAAGLPATFTAESASSASHERDEEWESLLDLLAEDVAAAPLKNCG